jgi:hypothetical protein
MEMIESSCVVRSPCLFMNTLAQYDFGKHNGRDITQPELVEDCAKAFNIDPEFAEGTIDSGIIEKFSSKHHRKLYPRPG